MKGTKVLSAFLAELWQVFESSVFHSIKLLPKSLPREKCIVIAK